MATISKRGNSWRAEISRQGNRKSATFRTKAQATAWAVKAEAELYDGVKAIAVGPENRSQLIQLHISG